MSKPLIFALDGVAPKIDPSAFIAPGAVIIGDVEIGPNASVWFNCVLRGDDNPIRIGARSNIQDGTVIHITRGGHSTIIGDDVLVGHNAIIHACTLESGSFVGMGATVLDGVVVETGAMIAAGAMVTPNKRILRGELWGGNPAKKMRDLTPEQMAGFYAQCAAYAANAAKFKAGLVAVGE